MPPAKEPSAEPLNGVANVFKPPRMTSHDVVAWLRRALGEKRVGHCGTLDPGAAGVLPVCVGKATGAASYISDAEKGYRVEMVFGVETDTQDWDGTPVAPPDRFPPPARGAPPEGELLAALPRFTGEILQVPPMYSAVKVDGQRLYALARQGREAEREARRVAVRALRLVRYAPPRAILDVRCSKGLYVRQLCADIAQALGARACVSFLLRTDAAGLSLESAQTLEGIEALAARGSPGDALLPTDALLMHLPAARLTQGALKRYNNGAPVEGTPVEGEPAESVEDLKSRAAGDVLRVYGPDGFLGVGMRLPATADGRLWVRAKKFL